MFDKLVDVFLQFLELFKFFDVVKVWEGGVVLRFGKLHRVAKPGLNWIIPFAVEQIITTGTCDEPLEIGPLSLTTKDKHPIVVSALMVSIILDVQKFLTGFEGGNAGLCMVAKGVVADIVQTHTLEELTQAVGEDAEEKKWSVSAKLTNRLRKRLDVYGAGVTAAQITELTPSRSLRLWGLPHVGAHQ